MNLKKKFKNKKLNNFLIKNIFFLNILKIIIF
jgi:hypothetical protein